MLGNAVLSALSGVFESDDGKKEKTVMTHNNNKWHTVGTLLTVTCTGHFDSC
jgi:hypothetical protein